MRALDVNLASRPFRNNTLLWVGYGLGFTVLFAALAWNLTTWLEHRGYKQEAALRLEDMDSRLAELDRRELAARREQARTELNLQALTVQAVAANEVIARKAFSWTRLFNRMEEAIPWNVHLTSVRPLFRTDRDKREKVATDDRESVVVSVEGFSKNLSAFLDFESALIDHESFDFPEPKRHQRNERNEILFELDFTYYPDSQPVVEEAVEPGVDEDVAAEKDAAPADAALDDVVVGAADGTPVGADFEGGPVEVGGDGPATAELENDAEPVAGLPTDADPTTPPPAVTKTVPPTAVPSETQTETARPGKEPPRIPPRPYATEPGKDAPAQQKARRPPPRRRDKDKKDEGVR